MNPISLSILTMIHYESCVRDTLEYCLNHRKEFKVEGYKYKKNALQIEITEQTPLKSFIDNNEPAKEKVLPLIEKINAEVYGDKSTILTLNKEGTELRVDKAQHLAIYESVIPLRNELAGIIQAHINFAEKDGKGEQQIIDLMSADENMFSIVALRTLFDDLQLQFLEFNKVKSEEKGKDSPQSNFIQNDIGRIVKQIHFVRDTTRSKSDEFWKALDQVCKVIEMTRGRREIPTGRNFQQEFALGFELINPLLEKYEATWQSLIKPALQELSDKAKANGGKINLKDDSNPQPDEKKN